ncbi:MAG: phosphoenolpyruvate-protein phosphotransferase system enzyme [Frankiaceae bacterium]|nr:phosphoenolpyruvate-protein phosphotransferase system enzyme [Frankiaceae bacterium]
MSTALAGIGVSPGTVAGPVARMAPPPQLPTDLPPVSDVMAEIAAAEAALHEVGSALEARASAAAGTAGKEVADVLNAQAMMARDPGLAHKVTDRIKLGQPAPQALDASFGEFRQMLAAAGPYLAERVADLDDIRNRAIASVLGVPMPGIPTPGHPFVLVAPDLAPADTATLDPAVVLGIVTEGGGPTSHTAILAKSLGLPAVVACPDAAALTDERMVLLDGTTGDVVADPSAELVTNAETRQQARRRALASSTGPGHTADGHAVKLLVNLGAARDLPSASAADSEGVGLFRTEFLFLDRPDAPTLAEQAANYEKVFAAFSGRMVVVRTLDAGADKPLRFATVPDEPNPALGVRGLRVARRLPELLTTQLTAIAKAAAITGADVRVMAPMVTTPAEAADFAAWAHAAGLPVAGVMVEVPAAALRASAVLAGCDFLSLGTNDLAQYTLAADRMNGDLADLLDPWQPALLDLVALSADAGQQLGKPCGVCGEAASDPLLALVLVGLGVTSLSMAPVSLPEVRAALAAHTLDECRQLAVAARAAADPAGARAAVSALLAT